MWYQDSRLIYDSLGPPKSTPEWRHNQFSHFCRVHGRDRQTVYVVLRCGLTTISQQVVKKFWWEAASQGDFSLWHLIASAACQSDGQHAEKSRCHGHWKWWSAACRKIQMSSPQMCTFPWGIWIPSNIQFLGTTRVHIPNSISIDSAVCAGLTVIRQITYSICSNRPHLASAAMWRNHTTIKTRSEFRNVGDAVYAMSHAAAEACIQRLAAGHRHGYRLAAPSLQPDRGTGSGPDC